jgi:chemotaxis protein MotB
MMGEQEQVSIYLKEEEDTEGSWVISYADMITVLLGFFVIFFSFDHSEDNEALLERSLLSTIVDFGASFVHLDESLKQSPAVVDFLNTRLQVEKITDKRYLIVFNDTSFFDSGSVNLTNQGQAAVNILVERIRPFLGQYYLRLFSFSDPTPVRDIQNNFYRDNLELSALRSLSVYRELRKVGIDESQVEISGGGVIPAQRLEDLFGHYAENPESYKYMRTTIFIVERKI